MFPALQSGKQVYELLSCASPSGSLPTVQVFPEPLLSGGGLFPVCAITENRIFIYILGTSGNVFCSIQFVLTWVKISFKHLIHL